MPVKRSKDSKGPYYQWGNAKKYYYTSGSKISRERAKKRASRQGVAIKINQRDR